MEAPVMGRLGMFFETGTEGICWVLELDEQFHKPENSYYGTFEFIGHGDRLRIFNDAGEVTFDALVHGDYAEGWVEYPDNPYHFGQPAALGYWIHWTQKGWRADDWARLFIHDRPRAELYKNAGDPGPIVRPPNAEGDNE